MCRPPLSSFLTDDRGAVTVDWVVMAAAVVGLGVGVASAVSRGTGALGGDIETSLSCASVARILYGDPENSYTARYLSQELADDRASVYRDASSDAIRSWHSSRARDLQRLIESGTEVDPDWSANDPWNRMGAGQTLDILEMHANELRARGEYPVPGVPDIDTLRGQFNAQFGC